MILAPEDCGCPVVEEGPWMSNTPSCSGTYLFMMYLQSYLWGRCDIATPCKRIVSVEEPSDCYDFIVVGGGTAGSIVAGRLSENSTDTVLLIEAGGLAPIATRVPSFYPAFIGDSNIDWRYRTVPSDQYCRSEGDKGCNWPRGKVLGGTSMLNGMMFHQGHKADYDTWVEMGATGWSRDELQPYFKMSEGNKEIGTVVKAEHHSDSGPMPVQRYNYRHPVIDILANAFNQSGIPIITDMNDPDTPMGVCIAQSFNKDGQRYSTARAYLEPQSVRPNLNILLNSHVSKVLIEEGKAVGVEYITSNGETKTVKANKEVILSAGALNSPQILMLSGIGPKETLESFDIEVVTDLPVGQNLRNHVGVSIKVSLPKYNDTRLLDYNASTEYLLNRHGPMSSSGITLTAMLYTSFAKEGQPDVQMFFGGFIAFCSRTGAIGEKENWDTTSNVYNVSYTAVALLPRSVGNVTLQSANPLDAPIFNGNYFDDPDDMSMVKEALQYIKLLLDNQVMQDEFGITLNTQYSDVCADAGEEWSDSWSECMIRMYTDPQNHQLGTTAIGLVIDPELKVYNIDSLRVCDAGSMPNLVTGNPQAPIMAVAEKCADLIKKTWSEALDYV